MKRIPILILFLPLFAQAQSPWQIEFDTRSGYEYNIFNANENRVFISEEGDTSSAVQSGFFQHFGMQVGWKKEIKAHQLSFKARGRYAYFPELSTASLFRPELQVGYAYSINKKTAIFFKGRFLKYQTNRIPDDTNVLLPPQSYNRGQADLGVKFRPFKYNKSQLRATFFRKAYFSDEDRSLRYNAFQINAETKQRFKRKGKPSNYLSLEFDFTRRQYVDERWIFEDVEEEDMEEEEEFAELIINYRTWQYLTAKVEYSFAFNKALRWKTGLLWQNRQDIRDQRFGYQQWQPYIKMELKKGKVSANWKIEGIFRQFTHLSASKTSSVLLRHQYLRASFNFDYALDAHWSIMVQANYRQRWRNEAENASTFLPYTRGILSAGIKYRF